MRTNLPGEFWEHVQLQEPSQAELGAVHDVEKSKGADTV